MSKRDADKIYTVTLVNKAEGSNTTIEVSGNKYILDGAEEQNVELPHACRAGSCIVCTGKVIEGSVDQSDHSFLKEKELNAGFVLICKAYPSSDCIILTHQEDNLLDL